MRATLEKEDYAVIAEQIAEMVCTRIENRNGKYIRTKKIPELYDVSKSYSEKLIRDMRESGRYDDAFICDERMILVSRDALEKFWRERGRSR